MLFSNSPVKTISEKIKPSTGLEKGKVSRLKFDRKSDYKTFLNFIKDNTKKLDIEKSDKGDSKKQAVGIMGVALLASIFGRGGDKDKDGFLGKGSLLSKAIEKAKLDAEAEARKAKQGTSGLALVSGVNTIQKFQSDNPFMPKRDPQTYRQKGANKKEYIFNRERRNKLVKSKQSVVSEERVYNQNRRKKRFVNTRAAAEIGGRGTGGAGGNRRMINVGKTFAEDPNFSNRPPESKTNIPEDIKKLIKVQDKVNKAQADFDAGRITKQQLDAIKQNRDRLVDSVNNKIVDDLTKDNAISDENLKKVKPKSRTADQIAKELKLGKKTLTPNFGRGIQTNLFNDPSVSFGNISGFDGRAVTSGVNPFRFDPREPFMDDDMGNPFRSQDRRFKQGSIFDQQRTRSVVDRDKFFTAPSVPKGQPKLSGFDRFNRFSSRIFNSPAYKFGMFLGGLMANYKVEIIKQLLTPTSLADGTLQGAVNNKLLSPTLNFTDGGEVTNIFVPQEGVSSSIPLNFDGNANASKGLPSDLAAPPNNIFLDSDSSELQNLFFIKLAG